MQETGSYGGALPDQVERIASLLDVHLNLISDVRELYRERTTIEREYATKLQALAKKAADKKGKIEAALAVGEDPTKAWDASTIHQNTLDTAYGSLVDSLAGASQDHISLADMLTSQVVEVLRVVEAKGTEAKKKEIQFFQKLIADRDRVYADRLKAKYKYDEECVEIETNRQKQGRVSDDKHADRVAKQVESQRNDMLNSKNIYLISIAIANEAKSKFYGEDLPILEDQFQALQTRLVQRVTKILQHSQALQLGHLDQLKNRINTCEQALARVDPIKDQELFIEHNIRPFTAPADWKFEPCATHYDTSDLSVEPAPKIFLQNKLQRCRSKSKELNPLIEAKRREADQLARQLMGYTADHVVGNIDEVSDTYLEAAHQLTLYTVSERILKAEIDTILGAVGDDEGGQYPHAFKSASFSIPTTCGYCKSSIWGLSKQGKTCKTCGISVHSKCELKVPADCQHPVAEQTPSVLPRKISIASTTGPGRSPPTASSFVKSVASEDLEDSYPIANVLFDFTATSEFELDVTDGSTVKVLEPDDGSGWVKVINSRGKSGLVPASYIEVDSSEPSGDSSFSGQRVRAVYAYQSQGDDELNLAEGEILELTSGSNGGQNYGDGWWEGINAAQRRGIFPSNYVELA